MNYNKIINKLKKENYIDDKNLFCHSYRNYQSSNNRIVYISFKNVGNTNYMPYFMLLSIKDDRLIISSANMFGGLKKYFASFELSKLKYETEFILDFVVKVYKFNVIDNDIYTGDFYIIVTSHKDLADKLVNYIKEYNK